MIEMLQVLRQSALFAEPDPSFVEASCWQLERLEEGQQLFGEPRSPSALALTAVGFVRILPSGFEALLCHCPGLQREPLKAVRDHWRSQGGLVLEGVEGEAALEDQLIEALETGRPTRCLLDRPADLFPRNRKLIDRLVVIADGCSCNPLYSQRLMRCDARR